ncbi:hypothetical protein BUALT_Bualt13G0101200 [Buddleja alternifolia]|uniref:Uncharacterized protein n=1 Tax=Buddleja alternifolia TaxID=168488 RepID=A0AAV6WX88_9LAMI|nr:hypothetical protein BUALT_Bualt13G0101200 [Buddleja alternifolia]
MTSWEDEDSGRRFHGCLEIVGSCRFRLWKDLPMCYRRTMVICKLHNRCEKYEEEISELMVMVEFLSEKIKELQQREKRMKGALIGLCGT